MAVAILKKTNDGNDLDSCDLSILQDAVNGFLNDEGYEYFRDLHEKVIAGEYQKPWLFGIENLTIDHQGWVYWKGKNADHFTFYEKGSRERLRKWSLEMADRCKWLEENNLPVNTTNVIWSWEKLVKS
jgi:hypothetical protein